MSLDAGAPLSAAVGITIGTPAEADQFRVLGDRDGREDVVAEHPERFARVVAANTFPPTGDQPAGPAFLAWREYSQTTPAFHAGGIVKGVSATDLAPEVVAAYDAPFPDDRPSSPPSATAIL